MAVRFHDFFAGIGGSSTGLTRAGMEGVVALNHWEYAIELHNANHPEIDHDQADVWTADPRRYRHAEVGWFSPECRLHSNAKGKKSTDSYYEYDLWRNPQRDKADDRSRMLMEAVPFIAERASYRYVLVENVVEVLKWRHFDRWLREMKNLDYEYKLLFLNSQFFGTPQSRDRFFAVFWKRGLPAPDLNFNPSAHCPAHGAIEAVQAWKPERWAGKYGAQYVYACPHCMTRVYPETPPASSVINWTLPAPRIGDRPKGLSPLTLRKIERGLQKFGGQQMIIDTAYTHNPDKAKPVSEPLFTQTTQQSMALVISYYGRESAVREAGSPLPTVPTENKLALVMANYGNPTFSPSNEPMPTVPTALKHYLIGAAPRMDDVRVRMLEPRELSDGTGFPRNYILTGNKKNQVRGIGGAVDSNVAKWIGERIMAAVN